ncbi:AmmeMemoRadiSam system protein A [Mesoaciditoga lauensis]|uniref:AmmeMemoRadiSam system protein A n=1 Tax=Mesoaciditoga lauensis TaxID=1495039 RepID=UPI00055EB745|nr:AmmeMemoRadiSam system protein A [Mesoaciditoga lauensis]
MKGEHPFVRWAIKVIESKVRDGIVLEPDPNELPAEMFKRRAGVFVTLHKDNGELRGCIGTFLPTTKDIAHEIAQNALEAALNDPRFEPVRPEELDSIAVSVDVLSTPEPVDDPSKLDPRKYGVIVESGWRRGLLLPDLEGVDTVEEQLRISKLKAGISKDERVKIYRFTVERYH